MCVALSRYIIWGWPEGDAGGDMARGGIEPDPIEYRGSNEWLVAPSRTVDNAPIALIDPHLGWYGQFRFYEIRMYAGELAHSGMAIVGMPLPSLGHSQFCSVAMTTGGPDAADCYEEEINPDNPRQYKYDDKWRDMTVRTEVIRVKDGDKVHEQTVEIEYTHHGPVVARKDGKAYTLKLPYFDQVQLADQVYAMMKSKNLAEMKEALSMLQLMEQNVMVGTVDGDIYYVRNARVPVRAPGFDYSKPLPGNTSKSEWLGIHPLADLVQVENPPQGYMQNCNVSPQFMMKNSPMTPEKWKEKSYLFKGFVDMADRRDNPLHQRAAMCVELLDRVDKLTVEQAMSIANSYDVYGADVWQKMLETAWATSGNDVKNDKNAAQLYDAIISWNRRTDPDSSGAIAYKYWKGEFGKDVKLMDRAGFPPPKSITDQELVENLAKAATKLMKDYGRLDVAFGEVYRAGRRGANETWPIGGGSVEGVATPRAVSFDPIEGANPPQFLGRGGQTSTQIVQLTKPPKSWTYLPLGESDDPKSPHYDDQAEKLYSKGVMKPTYFLDRAQLEKHVTARTFLHRSGSDE
jgi:acyl-homoserine lactone acylase PvdQ